jgi:hypothetical protein
MMLARLAFQKTITDVAKDRYIPKFPPKPREASATLAIITARPINFRNM